MNHTCLLLAFEYILGLLMIGFILEALRRNTA